MDEPLFPPLLPDLPEPPPPPLLPAFPLQYGRLLWLSSMDMLLSPLLPDLPDPPPDPPLLPDLPVGHRLIMDMVGHMVKLLPLEPPDLFLLMFLFDLAILMLPLELTTGRFRFTSVKIGLGR